MLALGVALIVGLMIVPLPTPLLDAARAQHHAVDRAYQELAADVTLRTLGHISP